MKIKNILYVSFIDYADPRDWGVSRKIDGQKKAFENLGYEVHHIRIVDKKVYINDQYLLTLNNRYDYYLRLPLKLCTYFSNNRIKFHIVYLRKAFFTPLYYCWFRQLKTLSDVILLEIPTYPYKVEINNRKIPLLLDDLATWLLKPMLFKIVTTQHFDTIFGLKTISIRNGYDFSHLISRERLREEGKISMITVSNLSFWHGIERVLLGLKDYHDDKNIINKAKVEFHIVGIGDAFLELKNLKDELGLEDVYFHGAKNGEELQDIYRRADIGVGSLGLYKKGTTFQSPLKNMEFCYQGIPFIIGSPDTDLADCDFVLEFPNDNSHIDIKKVVEWFRSLRSNSREIQSKGKSLYSWEKQVKIILSDVEEKMNIKELA